MVPFVFLAFPVNTLLVLFWTLWYFWFFEFLLGFCSILLSVFGLIVRGYALVCVLLSIDAGSVCRAIVLLRIVWGSYGYLMYWWLCCGLLGWVFCGCMYGCISIDILCMYRLYMLSSLYRCMSGCVCVFGGLLNNSRMIFFWVIYSGLRYCLEGCSCPHIVIP